MRILMTTDTVGGVWTYTRELVTGLLDAEPSAEILLVTLGSAASPDQLAWLQAARGSYGRRLQVELTTLPLEWQQGNAKAYIYAEPQLRRLANRFLPDIFHSNQFCFGALPLRCPKVVVAHSDVLSWMAAVRGPEAEEASASPWLQQYREMVSAGLRGADAVVAPTRAMLQDLQAGFGDQPRGRVIANGRSVSVPHLGRQLQAVTAGRVWDEAKGMAILEDLLCSMPVFVAGETTHTDASYDATRLRRRTITGKLTETQMLALFAESSIYIVTSLYEPFGLSAVEAAQCGCAVIARDIPSQREVWGDAATYFHDAEGLCEALTATSRSETNLHAAQQRAMLRVREHYLRDHMTAAYLDLYRSLCAASPQQGAAHDAATRTQTAKEHTPAA